MVQHEAFPEEENISQSSQAEFCAPRKVIEEFRLHFACPEVGKSEFSDSWLYHLNLMWSGPRRVIRNAPCNVFFSRTSFAIKIQAVAANNSFAICSKTGRRLCVLTRLAAVPPLLWLPSASHLSEAESGVQRFGQRCASFFCWTNLTSSTIAASLDAPAEAPTQSFISIPHGPQSPLYALTHAGNVCIV